MGLSKRNQKRVINSARNIFTSAFFQTILGITAFVERTVFIKCLSADYLGLNSLFSNVLYILSIAELGISSTIAFALYKPLAENDNRKVHIYMRFFKKAYNIIGSIILILGLCLSPFIDRLAKDPVDNMSFYFIVYLFSVGLTYFFSYRQILIEADQKKYVNQIIICLGSILQQVVQVVVLLTTRNYALYLFIFFVFNVGKYIIISFVAKKMYPAIKDKTYKNEHLDKSERHDIVTNVKAMFFHKFGEVAIGCSDGILISYLVDLVTLGIYANYQIILEAIRSAMRIFYSSVLASIGNMCATEDRDTIYYSFKTLNFTNYIMFSFASIAIFGIIQPIISIWIGPKYLLPNSSVFFVAMVFFLSGTRYMILNFHDAFGLFWTDKYKRVLEAVVNLVLSFVLGKKYGINGILIGTISSNLAGFWIDGHVVYKYAFHRSSREYAFMYIKQSLVTIALIGIVFGINRIYSGKISIWLELLLNIVMCLVIPIGTYSFIYRKNEDFISMKQNTVEMIKLLIKRQRY